MPRRGNLQELNSNARQFAQRALFLRAVQPRAGLRPTIPVRYNARAGEVCEVWCQGQIGDRESAEQKAALWHLRFEIVHDLGKLLLERFGAQCRVALATELPQVMDYLESQMPQ